MIEFSNESKKTIFFSPGMSKYEFHYFSSYSVIKIIYFMVNAYWSSSYFFTKSNCEIYVGSIDWNITLLSLWRLQSLFLQTDVLFHSWY